MLCRILQGGKKAFWATCPGIGECHREAGGVGDTTGGFMVVGGAQKRFPCSSIDSGCQFYILRTLKPACSMHGVRELRLNKPRIKCWQTHPGDLVGF